MSTTFRGAVLMDMVAAAEMSWALDPFPVWLIHAVPAVDAAAVLGWRWPVSESGKGSHPGLVITSSVLLVVLAAAGLAVTCRIG